MTVLFWFIACLAIGWLMIRRLDTGGSCETPGWVAQQLAWSGGLGLGLSSLVFFLSRAWQTGLDSWQVDGLLLGLLLIWNGRDPIQLQRLPWFQSLRQSFRHWLQRPFGSIDSQLGGILGISLLLTGVSWVVMALLAPTGSWDALMIWNHHAKFLYTSSSAWETLFRPDMIWWFENNYPLLVPGVVAKGWQAVGEAAYWVPLALGILFYGLTGVLLAGTLARCKRPVYGVLALLFLLSSPTFFVIAANQAADVPIAYYYLATFCALLPPKNESKPYGRLILAGLFAGLAAWTKNEGLLFCLVLMVSYLLAQGRAIVHHHARLSGLALALGMAPGLTALITLKAGYAPVNHLFHEADTSGFWLRLIEGERLMEMIQTFLAMVVSPQIFFLGILPVLLLVFRFASKPETTYHTVLFTGLLTWGLYAAGCAAVYLLSPYPLAWHMEHSQDRLIQQAWPTVLLLVMLSVQLPRDLTETEASQKPASQEVPSHALG